MRSDASVRNFSVLILNTEMRPIVSLEGALQELSLLCFFLRLTCNLAGSLFDGLTLCWILHYVDENRVWTHFYDHELTCCPVLWLIIAGSSPTVYNYCIGREKRLINENP